jgi:UDP-N-acetylmuramate dehydrogenase
MHNLQALTKELKRLAPALELREHEPMSRHTTFRVGGPATLMALPKNEDEAIAVVRAATEFGIIPLFLGNGSNLLVADSGLDRLVVKADGLNVLQQKGDRVTAGSGVLLSKLAVFALEKGLTGLEFAHGIPGSVGGAMVMNAGAYNGEMSQVVESVTCLTSGGERVEFTAEECKFGYRHSAFQTGEYFVISARFRLSSGEREQIKAYMDDLSFRRRSKQPLEYPSAGSTFKRPQGYFAAALIEQCGLKGLSVGAAQVSEKHSGFIVNKGGATCAEILELIEQVKARVFEATGVTLEPEVRILGGD